MIVFRLSKRRYRNDLSGRGAELSGGRWNSKGVSMVYTSESRALCAAEIAVHAPLGIIPKDYYIISIGIADNFSVKITDTEKLPDKWSSFPYLDFTKEMGDEFIRKEEFPVMKVPSAVIQGDYNYLINPLHPDSKRIKVLDSEPFKFDVRLFLK